MVGIKEKLVLEVRAHFELAREFYVTAENKDGVVFCQSRLVEPQ